MAKADSQQIVIGCNIGQPLLLQLADKLQYSISELNKLSVCTDTDMEMRIMSFTQSLVMQNNVSIFQTLIFTFCPPFSILI